MKLGSKKNKSIAFVIASLFVVTGTYNAIVINSDSSINGSKVKFVKRLDEVYGITVAGREVAAAVSWQKVAPVQKTITQPQPQFTHTPVLASSSNTSSAPEVAPEIIPAAAVQEELNLSLVEVINPTKYKTTLTVAQFSGALSTNNGVIESLNVALPNGEGVDVSFSEMSGNVFEYDLNGELYSGMMYQVDQNSFMVTMTNGPLEGTRMRFSNMNPADQQEQVQDTLAENNNIEAGNFGDNAQVAEAPINPDAFLEHDQAIQAESAQAQGFNLDQAPTL